MSGGLAELEVLVYERMTSELFSDEPMKVRSGGPKLELGPKIGVRVGF